MMNDPQMLLQHFDSVFGTETIKHINFSNMKLLQMIYDRLEEDIITSNAEYEKVRHEKVQLSSKFRETLSAEQKMPMMNVMN
ncbi:MAG: hypothetical protein K6B70_05135 [Clostridia bacterium]|nr:hypothetical protein [Clostridia bacterium]